MQSVFNELYNGTTNFDFARHGPDEAFLKMVQVKQYNIEKLMEKLDDEGKELFAAYRKVEGEIANIMRYNTFAGALRFGALFMAEVYITGEDWLDEEGELEESAER